MQPEAASLFLGHDNTAWTGIVALATIALVIATLILAFVAGYQIRAARLDRIKDRTVAVCEKYDTDPVLDIYCRELKESVDKNQLEKDPGSCRVQMFGVLNYLDGIAIGIEDGFYSKEVVKRLMEGIFKAHVKELLVTGLADRADPHWEYGSYESLIKLCNEWGANFPVSQSKHAPASSSSKLAAAKV